MKISQFTDYSLRTLIYAGLKEEGLSTVSEIAESYNISRNHLVKVVHLLTQFGILEGIKGRGGGIRLLLPAESINLGKLVRKIETDDKLVECFSKEGNCVIDQTCQLKGILHEAQVSFYKKLEEYYLSDILKPQSSLRKKLGQ